MGRHEFQQAEPGGDCERCLYHGPAELLEGPDEPPEEDIHQALIDLWQAVRHKRGVTNGR